ncbi:2-hydroxy-6-oxononadienedioate/2-hydroxy-6-oxononatrienedioate hydrolase [compost metagenome]
MYRLLILFLSFVVCSKSFAQNLDNYNLGFEEVNDSLAKRWLMSNQGDYKLSIDTSIKYSGKRSLLIEKVNTKSQTKYAMAGYFLPAKFEGSEIEIKLYMKLENVKGHIDLPFRIDSEDYDRLQFANLLKTEISGTNDWQQYSLKLPLQKEAARIVFYPTLYGSGKLWVDDVQILIDGKDISLAKIKPDYNPNAPPAIYYGGNESVAGKVKVKDAEIYYEMYGEGEPLLLLHGNSQSINVFKKQIKEFSKSYKVIAVDTRGQGKSTDVSSIPLTYDLFAEDMKTLLDSLNIQKVSILGWSDGGNTGLIMANKYPAYVDKLAVMGACMNPNGAVSKVTLFEVANTIKSLEKKTDINAKKQVRLFTMLLTEPHIKVADLQNIKSPVLVMAGEKDMILRSHTTFIADNIPKAKLHIFEGATHYAPIEIVSEFNTTVLNFLNVK